jgi:hypothetical protein
LKKSGVWAVSQGKQSLFSFERLATARKVYNKTLSLSEGFYKLLSEKRNLKRI